jgi:hypothetical protein
MPDVLCPRCSRPAPPENINTGVAFRCGGCASEIILDAFPAARLAPLMRGAESGLASEGVAVCFYHDHRAAVAACDGCGRYVCALCDVPVGKRRLCPECLALRNRAGRAQVFPNERARADLTALALAGVPVAAVMVPVVNVIVASLSLLTAPIALALVFLNWRKPPSLVGWSRAWLIVAGVLASMEILGWVVVFIFAFNHGHGR